MKKVIKEFIELGMEPSNTNISTLNSIHKRVMTAAIATIDNGGNHLVTSRWGDSDVREYTKNQGGNKDIYLESRIRNTSWILPRRHKNETNCGYMSRLNVWAWKFTKEFFCDIAVEEYGDMDDGVTIEYMERFYPNVEILGLFRYNVTYNKIVYEESIA